MARRPPPISVLLTLVGLAGACSLESRAIPPSAPWDGGPRGDSGMCEPGTVDVNGDPRDGCECTPTAPSQELCDGVDNDCDGATADGSDDPGIGVPCDGTDDDLCEEGTWVCTGGRAVCEDPTGNSREECNGVDDDCDGTIDENAGMELFLDADGDGYGVSDEGVFSCDPLPGRATRDGDCDDADPNVNPGRPESCNLLDDNCNGVIDDGDCECVSVVEGTRLYSFCSRERSWYAARDQCVARGQSLAALESDSEDAFVVAELRSRALTPAWVGLHDEGHEGEWRWVDETPIARMAWGPDEPNNGPGCCLNDENCGVVGWHPDPNTWNDDQCRREHFYVCESAAP